MKKREIIVRIILYVMAAGGIIMGLLYILTPTLLPYDLEFLGLTMDQLEPRVAEFMMLQKRIVGSSFITLSVALIILVGRFVKGDTAVRWAVLAMAVLSQASLLYGAFVMRCKTPWWTNILEIVLVFIAFFLVKQPKKKKR